VPLDQVPAIDELIDFAVAGGFAVSDGTSKATEGERRMAATKVPDKPAAAAVAAPLAIVLVWIANEFDLVVPDTVAAAFTSLLIAFAYWAVPDRP
jgi:hypothetical protein